MSSGTADLAARLVAGDRAALARTLTRLERDAAHSAEFDRLLAPQHKQLVKLPVSPSQPLAVARHSKAAARRRV